MKHDYVVKYSTKNQAYIEGAKMWKCVLLVVVFAILTSINF